MADENQPDKETGADAKTEGTDAKAAGTDAKTEGTDAKAEGTDAKAEGTDAKAEAATETEGADAKTEGTDAKTEAADAKTEGADAKTEAADAKTEGTDAKTEGTDAKAEAATETAADAQTQTLSDLADLRQAVEGPPPPETDEVVEPKLDAQGRAYATGKRKDAVARVWIQPGNGSIIVNGRDWETYFARPVLRMLIGQPLAAANRTKQYDVNCTVKGGGLSGQAGAVRHGVAKALSLFEPALRPTLKTGGFLTRDSRVVERKKYGRHKARRSHQFSKR